MKRRIAIQGSLIFFTSIASILLSKILLAHWKIEPIDEILDVIGIIFILFGFLLRISARGYKEEQSYQGKNLVKDGPYGLIRDPMYFGTLLIGTGIIFIIFQLWTLPLFLVVFLSIYIPQMKKEKEILSGRFGQDYKNYCKTTPKYFPRIYNLLNLRHYLSIKLNWIKKELSSFIAVITIIMAIETWQDIKLYGYRPFLKELLDLFFIIVLFLLLVIWLRKKNDNNS